MIQIRKDYKPYIQHVILAVLGLLALATFFTAPVFIGYLIYYSVRVAKLSNWQEYWHVDRVLPIGWTWCLVMLFCGVGMFVWHILAAPFLLIGSVVLAWTVTVIILAAKRGTLDHFEDLQKPMELRLQKSSMLQSISRSASDSLQVRQ